MILSTPWEQDGKEYVLELGRDVTNSSAFMMLPAKTAVSCGNSISSYSELAARDSFTGLYSKGHAKQSAAGNVCCSERTVKADAGAD